MKKVFNPGFFVFETGYNQGSSGGMIIVIPGDPEHSYYDPNTGRTYYNFDGLWYYTTELSLDEILVGPELDVSGMIEL